MVKKLVFKPLVVPVPPEDWLDKHFRHWKHHNARSPIISTTLDRDTTTYMEELGFIYDMWHCRAGMELMSRACTLCKLEFNNRRDCERHRNTWEHECIRCEKNGLSKPPNPKKCTVCDIVFNTIGFLNKHLQTKKHKHKVTKPKFYCQLCDKEYTSLKILNKHKKMNQKHLQLVSESELEQTNKIYDLLSDLNPPNQLPSLEKLKLLNKLVNVV